MPSGINVGLIVLAAALYPGPDELSWYRSLYMPDFPTTPCCGVADAYFADKVEPCGPEDPPSCALVAIITDTRPDTRVLPDGKVIHRDPHPVGTRVPIPRNKIRKNPSPNPTDHNIVFFKDSDMLRTVYCWEPVGGL